MEIKITVKQIVWSAVIFIVVVALCAGIWIFTHSSRGPDGPSPYSAVYLTSGDIYYGKLSWFPQPHLTDVWYLQRSTAADGSSVVSVAALRNVFWGPVDEINLNPKNILFWTNLRNDSQLVSGFENPQALSPGSPIGAASSAPTSSPSASGFKGPSTLPPVK